MTPSARGDEAVLPGRGRGETANDAAPVGALLMGGASSRMGRDKAELRLGGVTLAHRCAEILARVAGEVVQIGGKPMLDLGVEHVADLRPGIGPAGGIETALSHAAGRPVVVLAVDLPLVPATLLQATMAMVDDGALIAAPRFAGRWHPLCGAYAATILAPLAARLDRGAYGVQTLADEYAAPIEGAGLSALGNPDHMLFNVNTPDDLARAKELLSRSG